MGELDTQSQRLIEEGRRLRDDNRAGGRHRLEGSIGQGSRRAKRGHWLKKMRNIAIALFAIWVGFGILGLVLDGIGFAGVMGLVVASVIAVALFANYPKLSVPQRADLTKGNVRQMVARTELWLEHQAPALPPPAAKIVADMGVQLDALGLQLETVDQDHPAAREVRKLVGEHLPGMIDSYQRIPAHMRSEPRAGRTPDEQITSSLGKISKEIDSVTRQLAEGSLDELAVKDRFLEYRYGAGVDAPALDSPEKG